MVKWERGLSSPELANGIKTIQNACYIGNDHCTVFEAT